MLNTLNYSEAAQAFWSFTSSKPKWYLSFGDRYYSFDEDNKLSLHNSNVYKDNSLVNFIVNDNYRITKTFDNISYTLRLDKGVNFKRIDFSTNSMNGLPLLSADIDNREDTYRAAVPREATEGRFKGRLMGKYLSVEALYEPIGNRLNIPYINTTYRQSMI